MAFPNPKKTGKKMPPKGGKKCGYFLVALLALALCSSVVAQDTTKVAKGWGFIGAEYTHAATGSNGGLGVLGFMTKVAGPLYTAARIETGHYGVVNNDWILLTRVQTSDLYVGFIGGLDGTFVPNEATALTAYLNGAGGLLASYQSKWKFLGFENLNIWGVARYHFAFEGGTQYVNGWTAGVGVALPWF
jgi:hypothetical protein